MAVKLWFTADLHLGHANIIHHCARPFASVEDMDAALIANLNAVLSPGDRLFVVGDFCGQRRKAGVILSYIERIRLNRQQIVLILGNHDEEKESRLAFAHVHERYTVKAGEQRIVLDHYAGRVWNQSHRGAWQLYGHSHGNLTDDPHALALDIGVDCWNYKPVSIEQIQERMSLKAWRPVDHHGAAEAEEKR